MKFVVFCFFAEAPIFIAFSAKMQNLEKHRKEEKALFVNTTVLIALVKMSGFFSAFLIFAVFAKLHGKLPFMSGKLRLEPKHQHARLKLITVKLGEASLSTPPLEGAFRSTFPEGEASPKEKEAQ